MGTNSWLPTCDSQPTARTARSSSGKNGPIVVVQTFQSFHSLAVDVPFQMLNSSGATKVIALPTRIGRVHLHCKPESSAERPELMSRLVAESQQGECGDRTVFLACMCRCYFRKEVSSAYWRIQREREFELEKLVKMPENRKASKGVRCGMICEGE